MSFDASWVGKNDVTHGEADINGLPTNQKGQCLTHLSVNIEVPHCVRSFPEAIFLVVCDPSMNEL